MRQYEVRLGQETLSHDKHMELYLHVCEILASVCFKQHTSSNIQKSHRHRKVLDIGGRRFRILGGGGGGGVKGWPKFKLLQKKN